MFDVSAKVETIILTSNHCSTRVEQQLKELKLRLKLDKVFRTESKQRDFILFRITRLGDNNPWKNSSIRKHRIETNKPVPAYGTNFLRHPQKR